MNKQTKNMIKTIGLLGLITATGCARQDFTQLEDRTTTLSVPSYLEQKAEIEKKISQEDARAEKYPKIVDVKNQQELDAFVMRYNPELAKWLQHSGTDTDTNEWAFNATYSRGYDIDGDHVFDRFMPLPTPRRLTGEDYYVAQGKFKSPTTEAASNFPLRFVRVVY